MLGLARKGIEARLGKITKASSIYETEPWGFISENSFLNQVIEISTDENPDQLLDNILKLEKELGRERHGSGYSSRIIDIDILFYNNCIIRKKNLTIPHPRIEERMFTLVPLKELDEDMVHPGSHKTIGELYRECKDRVRVELYGPEVKA